MRRALTNPPPNMHATLTNAAQLFPIFWEHNERLSIIHLHSTDIIVIGQSINRFLPFLVRPSRLSHRTNVLDNNNSKFWSWCFWKTSIFFLREGLELTEGIYEHLIARLGCISFTQGAKDRGTKEQDAEKDILESTQLNLRCKR